MSAGPSASPPRWGGHFLRLWILIGAVGVAVILVVVLLFADIPGVSLNAAGGGSSKQYSVSFNETGLIPGVIWSVDLAGNNQSSSGGVIQFSEPDGYYPFTVGTAKAYTALPSSGIVKVNGSAVSVPITFARAAPLGTVFSWGVPVNSTGVAIEGCPSSVGHYCYAIEIAGAGQGVTTSNVLLALRTSIGTTVPWPSGTTVSLLIPTSRSVVATYSTVNQTWTLVPPFNGDFSGGDTVVIYTAGTGSQYGLFGDQLVAIGVNGFSGTVTSNTFS